MFDSLSSILKQFEDPWYKSSWGMLSLWTFPVVKFILTVHFWISSSAATLSCFLFTPVTHVSQRSDTHLYDTCKKTGTPAAISPPHVSVMKQILFYPDALFPITTPTEDERPVIPVITRSVVQLCIKALEWLFHCYRVLIVFKLHVAACKWKLPQHRGKFSY